VISAVIVEEDSLLDIEVSMMISINALIPKDRLDRFEEFHAWELFGGYGVFEGIEPKKRFEAIDYLLGIIVRCKTPIIYGAVNRWLLRDKTYASAEPMDICFRVCVRGIQDWLTRNAGTKRAILVTDECQKDIKATIKQSFRQLR